MRRVIVGLLAVLLGMTSAPALAADPPAPTALKATAPPPTYAGQPASIAFTLTTGDPAQPLADQPVTVQRRRGGTWVQVGTVRSDAQGAGTAQVTAARLPADNLVRLGYAGDATHAPATRDVTIPLRRRASRLTIGGPGRVVDEQQTRVKVAWRAANGAAVSGRVLLQVAQPRVVRRDGRRRTIWRWHDAGVLTTNARGVAVHTARPRVDTRWRARAGALPWVEGARSGVYRLDNVPPGRPVRLPAGAPRPRALPAQQRAVGDGPNPVITPIPDGMWASMVGRTWHSGCPVGRSGLRLVRVNYWDYTGYRRRGEIVVADEVAGQVAGGLSALYRQGLPIRSMYREDRFGWSDRLHGANDYRSMEAGNSSGFNCRGVVGNPSVRSPHSYGRSIDLNTWENPYRSRQGIVPNAWWQSRSHPRVAWRSRDHLVVQVLARHGIRWTYGNGDTQHFDAVPSGTARPLVVRCGMPVCH